MSVIPAVIIEVQARGGSLCPLSSMLPWLINPDLMSTIFHIYRGTSI